MKPELTFEGVSIETFSEIFASLIDEYKAIYGDDINVEQDSPDGQRLGIEAKLLADLQLFGANLYAQFDPDFSVGEVQNKMIKWAGITRNAATRSSAEVDITTDRNLLLESGYTIKDDLDQNWVTTSDNNLLLGTNTVTMLSEDFGDFEADPNTLVTPITIILGVISTTNPLVAVTGIAEETDEALRIRRNGSLENPSLSTVGSLFAKLANLEGVTDLQVYENDTDIADQLRDNGLYVPSVGMPAHAIWVVIEGGENADIIETIAKQKTAGTPNRGDESGIFLETLTNPDGTTYIITHVLKYDRPTFVDLYVKFNVKRKNPAIPIDITLIKQTLIASKFKIHEQVLATELYATIYNAGTNFIASDIEISDDDIIFIDESLTPDFQEQFILQEANIDITEVF